MKKEARSPTPSGVLKPVVGIAALLAILLILDNLLFCGRISAALGLEVFKVLLQFLLVTVIGGGVFAYFAARRDEQLKPEARIAGLQALDRELGDAYRAVKRVKRSMRAKLTREDLSSARVNHTAFEIAMEELLDAQIATEEVREHAAVRRDLIDAQRLKQLALALRYASRYLHDVYEDYERGRIPRDGEDYVINTDSPNLMDFLLADASPDDLKLKRARLRADGPLDTKFEVIADIEATHGDAETARRYGAITTECFRAVVGLLRAELAEALQRAPYSSAP